MTNTFCYTRFCASLNNLHVHIIPSILVSAKKKKGSRSASVKWSVKQAIDFAANPTVYIVQYKHHAGRIFNKHAMSKVVEENI